MPFLRIGSTVVEVVHGGARETTPYRVGESVRMFSGLLRSTIRAEKREWAFRTAPMTPAAMDALRALVANGAQLTVGGDAFSRNMMGAAAAAEVTRTNVTTAATKETVVLGTIPVVPGHVVSIGAEVMNDTGATGGRVELNFRDAGAAAVGTFNSGYVTAGAYPTNGVPNVTLAGVVVPANAYDVQVRYRAQTAVASTTRWRNFMFVRNAAAPAYFQAPLTVLAEVTLEGVEFVPDRDLFEQMANLVVREV